MTRYLTRILTHHTATPLPSAAKQVNGSCADGLSTGDADHGRALLRCVVENSPDGIAVVNGNGEIEIINPSAERILGRKTVDLIGTPIHSCIPWTPEIERYYAGAEADGAEGQTGERSVGPFEFSLHHADGVDLVVELQVNASGLPGSAAATEGCNASRLVHIYTFRDVTERKRQEIDQKRSIAEAMAASRAKSEFLANMSHELRTPLNAVIGFSEVIKSQPFGPIGAPQYAEYVDDIFHSGQHLLSVINDILDMSKIEAGEMQLTETVFDIQRVIESSLRLIAERARKNRLKLAAHSVVDLPWLRADERMVKQMLLNLLTNAVKFTPARGEVTVDAAVDAVGCLVVSVSDTGVGIAPEDMEEVLRPFGQADSCLQREFEGTGLGLPLVKSMAELHGAHLSIDSTPNVGTTVTIRFPVARVMARAGNCAA